MGKRTRRGNDKARPSWRTKTTKVPAGNAATRTIASRAVAELLKAGIEGRITVGSVISACLKRRAWTSMDLIDGSELSRAVVSRLLADKEPTEKTP